MPIITLRVDEETAAVLDGLDNKSEFIRAAIKGRLAPVGYVMCDICGREDSGRSASLKDRGWEFRRGEQFCPEHRR